MGTGSFKTETNESKLKDILMSLFNGIFCANIKSFDRAIDIFAKCLIDTKETDLKELYLISLERMIYIEQQNNITESKFADPYNEYFQECIDEDPTFLENYETFQKQFYSIAEIVFLVQKMESKKFEAIQETKKRIMWF